MTVEHNLSLVKDEVKKAQSGSALAATLVSIIAVSKSQEVERIQQALDLGHRIFGENRLQEAQDKWPGLKEKFQDIELHLIGPLQSNKARKAVALFDVIETIDRPKIAAAIARAMEESGRRPKLLIQVNTGEEKQKAGVAPADFPGLLDYCRSELNLRIDGLMCIPPANEAPSPHFALLQKFAIRHNLPILSMGMSADYIAAVELGATHVRVGTAVFGRRI